MIRLNSNRSSLQKNPNSEPVSLQKDEDFTWNLKYVDPKMLK